MIDSLKVAEKICKVLTTAFYVVSVYELNISLQGSYSPKTIKNINNFLTLYGINDVTREVSDNGYIDIYFMFENISINVTLTN